MLLGCSPGVNASEHHGGVYLVAHSVHRVVRAYDQAHRGAVESRETRVRRRGKHDCRVIYGGKGEVEVKVDSTGAVWRKSKYSGPDGNCVEVAFLSDGNVGVRDTKDCGSGPILAFTPGEWDAFVSGVTDGKLRPA